MVLKVSSAPVVLLGYTLILLILANGTKGSIEADVKSILAKIVIMEGKISSIEKTVKDKCPASDGFFYAPGTGQSQCLKAFTDLHRNWEDAKKMCEKEPGGLVLAQPFNARALRRYLNERINTWSYWVGAKGNGTYMVWEKPGRAKLHRLRKDSPLWQNNEPGDRVTSFHCMVLAAAHDSITAQPEKVYFSKSCLETKHTLCERILT